MSSRTALLVPGLQYTVDGPLFYYADEVLTARKSEVGRVRWSLPRPRDAATHLETVCDCVSTALAELGGADPVLVGKSLGSLSARIAAARGLPAIWFTPLLRTPVVVEALRSATAPVLLIGGDRDRRHWDGALARTLTPYVLEIPGADHKLLVDDRPVIESIRALGAALSALESFLDEVVWPPGAS